nr:EAL domain-containing protein [uncultured Gellertiella sp.]
MLNVLDTIRLRKQETRRARLQGFGLFFVVLCATLASVFFADRQRALYEEENSRNMVTEQLSVLRSEIEGRINGDIFLLKGLVAALEADPAMSGGRFHDLARRMLGKDDNISVVTIAPDMVVAMAYPPERVDMIGFDYRKRNKEHGAAFLAAQSRKVNVSGPVDMAGGHKGLVVNYPVLVDHGSARAEFWGLLSATIDLNGLFSDSGLLGRDLPLDVALSSGDRQGAFGAPFFGADTVFGSNPVRMTIPIGQNIWLLAAVPKSGWHIAPAQLLAFRLLLLLVASAIVIPVLWSVRLMGERHRALRHIEQNSQRLQALSRRLEIALDTSGVGIWEHDLHDDRQIWDERVRSQFGVTEEKPFYTSGDWEALVHPDDLAGACADYEAALQSKQHYFGQYRIITGDTGEIRHIRTHGRLIETAAGRERLLGVDWDITEDVRREEALRVARQMAEEQNRQLEQARQQMEFNSLHDALTGLANRRYLDQILGEKRSGADQPLTILHLDLDRFKDINDTLGHAAGDSILRHAANVLRAAVEPGDFIARIGGDEFVIVSTHAGADGYFDCLSTRIISALTEPVLLEGQECRAGVSIGVATQAEAGESPEQLLINADIALYEAKKRGRGRMEFFTDTLRAQAINTKQTADEILRALEQGEFVTFFQPQFDAHTLEIDGVEALVRWEHPQRGLVPPDQFLRIAESLNVMQRIDEIVLDQALFHFHQWRAVGLDIPRVSVNISTQRLLDPRLVEKMIALQIEPGTVCFELLESISFEEQDDTLVAITALLKEIGIDIEIDDFGTGHASIVNLLKLTPRRLKIDRQLIRPILDEPRERQLVSSIIDIGRTCGISIVAEGVESMEHAAMLRDMGCQTLQGYAFARPMRPTELLTFARQQPWRNDTTLQQRVLPLRRG